MRTIGLLGVIGLLSAGCFRSAPGFVKDSEQVVTIGGGEADLGGGNAFRVWYFIDRQSQTCWIRIGDVGGAIDCCNVRRVEEAKQYITWENEQSCQTAPVIAQPVAPAS